MSTPCTYHSPESDMGPVAEDTVDETSDLTTEATAGEVTGAVVAGDVTNKNYQL